MSDEGGRNTRSIDRKFEGSDRDNGETDEIDNENFLTV